MKFASVQSKLIVNFMEVIIKPSVFLILSIDIWGPYKELCFCDAHYFLMIIDDASQTTSDLPKNFITMVKFQFKSDVKIVRNDNGSKFTSGPCKNSIGRMQFCVQLVGLIHLNKMKG